MMNMVHVEIVTHTGGDAESRYIANGRRISRDALERLEIDASVNGSSDSYWTRAKEVESSFGKTFRRVNGKSLRVRADLARSLGILHN